MDTKRKELYDYWDEESKLYDTPKKFSEQKKIFSSEVSESSSLNIEMNFDYYSKIKTKVMELNINMFSFLSGITILELMKVKNVKKYSYGYPVDMANRTTGNEVNANLNTIINTIFLDEEQTINEFFGEVQKSILKNLENADIDYMFFSNKFSNDGRPLFDTLLNYDYTIKPQFIDSEKVEITMIDSSKTRVPIEFYFTDNQYSLSIKILFDKRVLNKSYVETIKNNINNTIDRFLNKNVEENILSLISEEIKINNFQRIIDQNAFEHILKSISENAVRIPEKCAIEYGNTVISYRKLWQDVTSVAYDIHKKVGNSKPRILIDGSRNYETIVNIIASWINRAVVIPVDGTQPLERIKNINNIAKPKYVLGSSNNLSKKLGIERISMSRQGQYDTSSYFVDEDAYVYFTSGTTGKPKGILGWHGALANFINWEKKLVSQNDRFMQLTKPFFDVYLRDILTPLVVGATIVIPSDDEVMLQEEANKFINKKNITALHIVPTLANLWTENRETISNRCVKVFFAGEPLTRELVENWFHSFRNSRITNLYGPTEGTLAKFSYTFRKSEFKNINNIPVGKPITAADYYIGRKHGDMWYKLGKYEVGVILIESNYLTRGYVGGDENHSFISDSLYNTEDLGYIDNFNLVHVVGRADNQIKIDGIRIQPNEIIEVITELPEITWSTVIFNRSTGNLSAYLMSYTENINVRKIIDYLSDKLPSQFIPKEFYRINKLDMKLNGKIDRNKMISNGSRITIYDENIPMAKHKINSESFLDMLIKKIFEEELHLTGVGLHDNFFKIGGNSLKAAKTIGALNSLFHIKMSYRYFLLDSTPKGVEKILLSLTTNETDLNHRAKTIMEELTKEI